MPTVQNIADLIQAQSRETVLRTVILHDKVKDTYVYTGFHYHYDSNPSISSLEQLFDDSFNVLKLSTQTVQDETNLPLVKYVGRWHITMVTKSLTGVITCVDATNGNIDTYLGVGG